MAVSGDGDTVKTSCTGAPGAGGRCLTSFQRPAVLAESNRNRRRPKPTLTAVTLRSIDDSARERLAPPSGSTPRDPLRQCARQSPPQTPAPQALASFPLRRRVAAVRQDDDSAQPLALYRSATAVRAPLRSLRRASGVSRARSARASDSPNESTSMRNSVPIAFCSSVATCRARSIREPPASAILMLREVSTRIATTLSRAPAMGTKVTGRSRKMTMRISVAARRATSNARCPSTVTPPPAHTPTTHTPWRRRMPAHIPTREGNGEVHT